MTTTLLPSSPPTTDTPLPAPFTAGESPTPPATGEQLRSNRAAVYCRVSTEEQRERETIKTQVESTRRRSERDALSVHDFYQDDGVSGIIPFAERPEGARLLQDARRGLFNVLYIYKVDRLGRDVIVTLTALREIHALGVTIVSATETLDLSSPAGWAMAAVISAFGQLERENFLARSKEATDRLAREGVWLGGIVPYGYRVTGKGKDARLMVADAIIPGTPFSEADIARLIYRMSAQGLSCMKIADHLNALGIPTSYTRDERTVLRPSVLHSSTAQESIMQEQSAVEETWRQDPLRGKRKQRTRGIWRSGRVRNMIVSQTYKGIHHYGKRSQKPREPIMRAVPAIVSPEIWQQAQATLEKNRLYSKETTKRFYLLRGLAKCGLCGLTYVGTAYSDHNRGKKAYYVCTGKNNQRGLYGERGQRCPSKAISAHIEELVWRDVEEFLRYPGEVLKILAERQEDHADERKDLGQSRALLQKQLEAKNGEKNAVITLFRKQSISEEDLNKQLEEVRKEEAALKRQWELCERQLHATDQTRAHMTSVEELLQGLHRHLDEPMSPERKREVVQTLVKAAQVDTVEVDGKKQAHVTVHYSFLPDAPTPDFTDTDS